MAGRPVKMAEKVTALEAKMNEVYKLLLEYTPSQYVDRPPTDELGEAWRNALDEIREADHTLSELGDMLRDKAGTTLEQTRARIAELQRQSAQAEPIAAGAS